MHLSKSIEYTTPRVNLNVNYELELTKMYQYQFINFNKCTTPVQDVIEQREEREKTVNVL